MVDKFSKDVLHSYSFYSVPRFVIPSKQVCCTCLNDASYM
jgi:hypothetical protein